MDEFRFKSLGELYKKLLPALNTKVGDLKRANIKYIKEIDVWNYLKDNYWKNRSDLTLGEMVNDILSTPNFKLEEYATRESRNNKSSSDNLL